MEIRKRDALARADAFLSNVRLASSTSSFESGTRTTTNKVLIKVAEASKASSKAVKDDDGDANLGSEVATGRVNSGHVQNETTRLNAGSSSALLLRNNTGSHLGRSGNGNAAAVFRGSDKANNDTVRNSRTSNNTGGTFMNATKTPTPTRDSSKNNKPSPIIIVEEDVDNDEDDIPLMDSTSTREWTNDPTMIPMTGSRTDVTNGNIRPVEIRSVVGSACLTALDHGVATCSVTSFGDARCGLWLVNAFQTKTEGGMILCEGDSVYIVDVRRRIFTGTSFSNSATPAWIIRRVREMTTMTTTTTSISSGTKIILQRAADGALLSSERGTLGLVKRREGLQSISAFEQWHICLAGCPVVALLPTQMSNKEATVGDRCDDNDVIELIAALLGVGNRGLVQIDSTQSRFSPFAMRGRDPTMLELASRALPIISQACFLREFASKRLRPEWGRIANGFASALLDLVLDQSLATIIVHVLDQTISLQRFLVALQPAMRVVAFWEKVARAAGMERGGALLSRVVSARREAPVALVGAQGNERSMNAVVMRVWEPYEEMLRVWVCEGRVEDAHAEFMLKEDRSLRCESLETDVEARFWTHRFALREEIDIPSFLRSSANTLLKIGRDASALLLSGVANPVSEFDARRFCFRGDDAYVEKVHDVIAKALLKTCLQQGRLSARLRVVQNLMLLTRGDFIAAFMSQAREELLGVVVPNGVSEARLRTHLRVCLREHDEAFQDDFTCKLLPFAVDRHLGDIHSVASSSSDAMMMMDGRLLGVEALVLEHHAPWPASLVLSKRALLKYQLLFRHLFRCKFVETRVCAAWMELRSFRFQEHEHVGSAHVLCNRMMSFMQGLSFYCSFSVLLPHLTLFQRQMDSSAKSIDDVVRFQEDFLDTSLCECLLTNPTLLQRLAAVFRQCLDFAQDVFLNRCSDPHVVTTRMLEFDARVISFMETVAVESVRSEFRDSLSDMVARLDYNAFYSEKFQHAR